MATVLEALKGVSAYPVPLRTITEIAEGRGLALDSEITSEIRRGREYNLAKADLLMWLSVAPNISQGGQTYSFTDEQQRQFRNEAQALYDEFVQPRKTIYGYKGSSL